MKELHCQVKAFTKSRDANLALDAQGLWQSALQQMLEVGNLPEMAKESHRWEPEKVQSGTRRGNVAIIVLV